MSSDLQLVTRLHVSDQTVRKRLHEGGWKVQYPSVGPALTAQHHAEPAGPPPEPRVGSHCAVS